MPGILDAVHSILGKITGLHGAGQWGFLYDKNGFQIAPAGMDGAGGSTASNSEGLSGAPVGIAGFPPIVLNRQVGVVGNGADATADVLYAYTLKAKALTRVGQSIVIYIAGTTAANGNNKSVVVNFGGTAFTIASAVAANAKPWWAEIIITKTGANTQIGNVRANFNASLVTLTNTSMAETDTSDIVINVTGQSGSSAASDVTVSDFKVEMEQF